MATYVLPDTVHGGSVTVSGNSLADAQQNAASQTGASLAQQQGGGTFGVNTNPNIGGGGSSGGGAAPASSGADQVAASIQKMLNAVASGNKQAFDETVREWNAQFGLDTQKFQDDVRRFNENLAIAQSGLTGTFQGQQTQQAIKQANDIALANAGLTGTFQGQQTQQAQQQQFAQQQALANLYGQGYASFGAVPTNATTLAAQQQAYAQQMGAVNAAAALQANPFRQAQVIGQAGRILQGLPSAGFSAPNTVAGVGTAGGNTQGGMGYLSQLIDDIKNPAANTSTADSFLAQTPTPNKLDSASFLRSTPGTQNLILQAMQEKYGIDPNDALTQIKNTLPQFAAPNTTGVVRRG